MSSVRVIEVGRLDDFGVKCLMQVFKRLAAATEFRFHAFERILLRVGLSWNYGTNCLTRN